jgi:hypothetical protein
MCYLEKKEEKKKKSFCANSTKTPFGNEAAAAVESKY